jgi:hypothetical protein
VGPAERVPHAGGSVPLLRRVSAEATGLVLSALFVPAALVITAGLTGERRLLAGVVTARLVALKRGLLLRVEVLLVSAVFQVLGVYPKLFEEARMLLRVDLIHTLELLCSLLMISAQLSNQIHDLLRVKPHSRLSL